MTRILVVDDDAAVRNVVTDALLEDGYQVDAACNGRQALAAFRKHRPDALVLDLEMPMPALWKLQDLLEQGQVEEAEKWLTAHYRDRLKAIRDALAWRFPRRADLLEHFVRPWIFCKPCFG